MLMVSLNYENSCCEEEYKPIQDALLAGEDWGVINCELFDDVLVIEEATVDLGKHRTTGDYTKTSHIESKEKHICPTSGPQR